LFISLLTLSLQYLLWRVTRCPNFCWICNIKKPLLALWHTPISRAPRRWHLFTFIMWHKTTQGVNVSWCSATPHHKASEKTLREPIFASSNVGFFWEAVEKQSNVTAKQRRSFNRRVTLRNLHTGRLTGGRVDKATLGLLTPEMPQDFIRGYFCSLSDATCDGETIEILTCRETSPYRYRIRSWTGSHRTAAGRRSTAGPSPSSGLSPNNARSQAARDRAELGGDSFNYAETTPRGAAFHMWNMNMKVNAS